MFRNLCVICFFFFCTKYGLKTSSANQAQCIFEGAVQYVVLKPEYLNKLILAKAQILSVACFYQIMFSYMFAFGLISATVADFSDFEYLLFWPQASEPDWLITLDHVPVSNEKNKQTTDPTFLIHKVFLTKPVNKIILDACILVIYSVSQMSTLCKSTQFLATFIDEKYQTL